MEKHNAVCCEQCLLVDVHDVLLSDALRVCGDGKIQKGGTM